ncbi:MAG: ATP-binding protein [Actinomycetota bacterium]
MLRTLRSRLTVIGIVVALVAVVVTAISVRQLTESDIRGAIERDLDVEFLIRDEIAFHGLVNGGWDDIEATVADLSLRFDERIAVASLAGEVLADSEVLVEDSEASLPSQALIVDPESTLVDFGFEDLDGDDENDAVASCLADIGVGAVGVAADTGVVVVPVRELSEDEALAFLTCAEAQDVLDAEFFLEELDPADIVTDIGDADLPIGAIDVEPVQLFIGYGDQRDDPVLASLGSAGFWVPVLIVLALIAGGAALMASRLARPLSSLTAAARRMRHGDLAARAEIGGAEEIATLGSAFNEMASSLQAEDQARKTLTTDVAHELRSPLANLRGYLEGIQDGVVEPDAGTIASLHEEATAMQTLVDDLQQLSLAETGRLHLRREDLDVGDLVERAVAAHRGAAAAAGVDLAASTTPGLVTAVDPDRFRQVLGNLIGNALRHTAAGGSVDVLCERSGATVLVRVSDTGIGIEPHHLPHLFERFYRADESRSRATGGSGLGLAITQELIRAHDGEITVTSAVGQGTAFTILLPIVSAAA